MSMSDRQTYTSGTAAGFGNVVEDLGRPCRERWKRVTRLCIYATAVVNTETDLRREAGIR